MESNLLEGATYTALELRTSSNNMMCVVTYEPLPKELQEEIEKILKVAN